MIKVSETQNNKKKKIKIKIEKRTLSNVFTKTKHQRCDCRT